MLSSNAFEQRVNDENKTWWEDATLIRYESGVVYPHKAADCVIVVVYSICIILLARTYPSALCLFLLPSAHIVGFFKPSCYLASSVLSAITYGLAAVYQICMAQVDSIVRGMNNNVYKYIKHSSNRHSRTDDTDYTVWVTTMHLALLELH